MWGYKYVPVWITHTDNGGIHQEATFSGWRFDVKKVNFMKIAQATAKWSMERRNADKIL